MVTTFSSTSCSIQVLAFTRMGDGVESQPTFCHTEEDGKFLLLRLQLLIVSTASHLLPNPLVATF